VIVITLRWRHPCSNIRMKTQRFLSSLAVLALTVGSTSYADEIYKWIDKDGNVHYEDRPSEV